jgi:hypothetical protein
MIRRFFSACTIVALAGIGAACPEHNAKTEWTTITLQATGHGATPADAQSPAQGQLLACRAANVDAKRMLLEQLGGVAVDSETHVRDLIVKSDTIRTRAEGYIQHAKVVSEQTKPDGTCEVKVEIYLGPDFGQILR